MIRRGASLVVLSAAFLVAIQANAATRTWTGASNAFWSNAANWQEGVVPANGDHVLLTGSMSFPVIQNDLVGLVLDSLEIDSNVILLGNQLDLTSTVPLSVDSQPSVGATLRFRATNPTIDLRPGASPALGLVRVAGGTLTVNSPNAYVAFDGGIVEESQVTLNLDVGGVQIESHAFSDGISVSGGGTITAAQHVILYGQYALGNGGLTINANEFYIMDGGIVYEPLILNSSIVFIRASATASPLQLNFGGILTTDAPLAIQGPLQSHQSFYIGGGTTPATIELGSHGNDINVPIIVQGQGTLVLSTSFTLSPMAQLFVNPGGTLDLGPTNDLNSASSLSCRGTLATNPGATLVLGSAPVLDGCTLQLRSGSGYPMTAEMPLIQNTSGSPVQGTFANMPEGTIVNANGVDRMLSYAGGSSGHDIVLKMPPAAHIDVLSGNHMSVAVGDTLQNLFIAARVVDANNQPLPGKELDWSSSCVAWIGSPLPIATNTNGDGVAQTTIGITAGSTPGPCAIHVRASDGSSASADLIVHVYDPARLHISATPSSVNAVVNQRFTVGINVTDGNGSSLPNLPVTVGATNMGGATAVPFAVDSTDLSGQTTITATASGVAGMYELDVKSDVRGPTLVIPVTQSATAPPMLANVQDMWWSPVENGWGMSLVQHNDTLFAAMYIYDASGKPTWLVMPGGAWDSTHTIYTGSLYTPSGTPFFAYDASRMVTGSAKGSVTITFQDANDAILDYTIGGISGRKLITREIFANGSVVAPDRSDLWWGGLPQNGWGITILQQASTLFPVWFTYDSSGAATWYVMPGGTWTSGDTYEGRVYRTTGAPWVGHDYDPAKLLVFDAGTYRIQFTGDSASFTYAIDSHSGTIPLVREPF